MQFYSFGNAILLIIVNIFLEAFPHGYFSASNNDGLTNWFFLRDFSKVSSLPVIIGSLLSHESITRKENDVASILKF